MLNLKPVRSMPDRKACLDVYRGAMAYFLHVGEPYPSRSTVEDDRTWLPQGLKPQAKHYDLIEQDGQAVGVLDVIAGYPDDKTVLLKRLVIPKPLRRHGLASKTLAQAAAYWVDKGYSRMRVILINPTTKQLLFWQKRHFQTVSAEHQALPAGIYEDVTVLDAPLEVPALV